MKILSRLRDESVVIGGCDELFVKVGDEFRKVEGIRLTVVDIREDKVRLGFDAPTEISVHREEVYNAIRRERAGGGA